MTDGEVEVAARPLAGGALVSGLGRELRASYALVRRDLSASVIPGLAMCLSAMLASRALSGEGAAWVLPKSALYFSLYIYVFCLDNQITGYVEDCHNKPDRPLPSGYWDMAGARQRRALGSAAFLLFAWAFGEWRLLALAAAWLAIAFSYNHWGLHRHWFSKNLVFITAGTFVLLGAAWSMAAAWSPMAVRLMAYVSVVFGATLHLQDFRDVPGDAATGRRTLPIALGAVRARWVVAASIAVMPILTRLAFTGAYEPTSLRLMVETWLGALNLGVAGRLLLLRTPDADDITYRLHTFWFCSITALAGPLMSCSSVK
jgi:4-hydroxybenzoate polyprenyltransferase